MSPVPHTIDEAVHGPTPVSLVSLEVSTDRTLALMTPRSRPTSTRSGWAGYPQVTSGCSPTRQPLEGLRNWKRPHRQVFWHLSVCSVVNEARAPRLATRDQPSPSKPVHPLDGSIITLPPSWRNLRRSRIRNQNSPHSLGEPPSIIEGSHISIANVTRAGLSVIFSTARRACSMSVGP
jgi:hypothetical protein